MVLLSSLVRVVLSIYACSEAVAATPAYHEHLDLRPLPVSSLLASFNFRTYASTAAYDSQNFALFPRSLGQILQHAHTKELHLRFSSGRWDTENWGSRPRAGNGEGGTGVELWAWVEADNEQQAEARWLTLTNALSGLFCASLNFVDSTRTVRPVWTFDPQGDHSDAALSNLHLLHGSLPGEVVCTENLTPFLKLLPCKGKAGISSLLDGHKIFDSSWQSMAIDVQPMCPPNTKDCFIEMQQSVDMVLSIERAKRPRDDPIPKPLPMTDISCDSTKYYSSYGDTCFPLAGPSSPSFSLSDIFGRSINGACPFMDQSSTDGEPLCLEIPQERLVTVETSGKYLEKAKDGKKCFDMPVGVSFNLTLDAQETLTPSFSGNSMIRTERTLTGYGQQHGGMRTVITNLSPTQEVFLSYFESIPWFMRIFLHTLRAEVLAPNNTRTVIDPQSLFQQTFYRPAVDRVRASHLELRLPIKEGSALVLTYEFEKTILRYSEYPPDANRGFNIPSAVIRILYPLVEEGDSVSSLNYIRTTSLLLYLPTPDFSMPYNVIILTSTVIALCFGTIFNILARRFVAKDEGPSGGRLQNLIRQQIVKLRAKLASSKSKKE